MAAESDIVDRLRREVARTAARTRNGLRYVTGAEWAPESPTPRDRIWQQGPVSLWRYRSDAVTFGPPVVMFIGLVSRSTIFDLHQENSLAARLRDAGFDAWVLDWGVPGPEDATNTLETYLTRYLPRALAATLREARSREVTVLGYCMGGDMALLALASDPSLPVRNLVTMATPVDFSRLTGLAGAVLHKDVDPDALIDWTGNVPAQHMAAFFRARNPTAGIVAHANLWENLWSDAYVRSHQAMARWAGEHVPFPGAAFRQVYSQWFGANAFMSDGLRLGGRSVRLSRIHCPTLSILALRDDLVVPEAARPLRGLLGVEDFEQLELDAGHAGITASRTAARVTFPALIDWLERHSDRGAPHSDRP